MTKPEFLRNRDRRLLEPEEVFLGLNLKGPNVSWHIRPEQISEARRPLWRAFLAECEAAGRHVPASIIASRAAEELRELGGVPYVDALLRAEGDLRVFEEEIERAWLRGQTQRLTDGEGETGDQDWIDAEAAAIDTRYRGRCLQALAFSAGDLAGSEAPPRTWHAGRMIPSKAVTLLQGDGGSGKSTLACQLLVSTVLGRPWLGQEVRQGGGLYLSCEDDRDEVHRRLDAIAVDQGVGFGALAALTVLDMTGKDAVLAAADRNGVLMTTPLWSELEELVAERRPSLVVIDNLADVFAGDENSRAQARQFVSRLQGCAASIDAALVLIGHPSLAGMASGTGSSGSTAWNNSVRSRLYMSRPVTDETIASDPDVRVLTVKKANYAPTSVEVRLRWGAGVFHVEEDGNLNGPALAGQMVRNRADQVFLELLASYAEQGRKVSHTTGHGYAPAAFAKEERAAKAGLQKAALAAAMNRLFERGAIRVAEEGPPSRRISHLVIADREGC